ncbi:response regulator [Methanobacterium alcaliphilum]|uniref:response regulator n=1 Tax=Methanobacterium alcaliphilum TaxID=392018 RepID=UPI00200AEDB3|nr:response regulator [Methanobacterium alcaliphilum]MCK9150598.1 response regulator [Methanobacterium alcaliphilum]
MADEKILIVEDERILALGLKKKLQKLGFNVTHTVSSGEDAVKSVKENKPDLILMDIVLQGELDGIDAAKMIINMHNIPIIYLTAYADDETIERAVKTYPYGYLMKPYKERELKANIEMALKKFQAEKESFMDFEDVYVDITSFIDQKDEVINHVLLKHYGVIGPLDVDISSEKIYVSAERSNKKAYTVFYELLNKLMSRYLKSEFEIVVYSKGDNICLEFPKM